MKVDLSNACETFAKMVAKRYKEYRPIDLPPSYYLTPEEYKEAMEKYLNSPEKLNRGQQIPDEK